MDGNKSSFIFFNENLNFSEGFYENCWIQTNIKNEQNKNENI